MGTTAYKISLYTLKEGERLFPEGVVDSHPNYLPKPFESISRDEYLKLYSHAMPNYIDFRQVKVPEFQYVKNFHIYCFSDYALAMGMPSGWTTEDEKFRYLEDPVYFYIGCRHEDRELSAEEARREGIRHEGMHHHVLKCDKCNRVYSVDSSG